MNVPRHTDSPYLGPVRFCKWEHGLKSLDAVKQAIQNADLSKFLQARPAHFRDRQERFNVIVEQVKEHLQFCWPYERFGRFLASEMPNPADCSPGADVYRKLLRGLLREFENRELSTA